MIQTSQLSIQQWENLENLSSVCKAHDGVLPKIYWDIIAQKREYNSNFLYYSEDTLVGYLSFFLFEEQQAEILTLVHPDYRNQGIFFQLFQTAAQSLKHLGIQKTIFVFPQENEMIKECLQSLDGHFLNFEFHMERFGNELEARESSKLEIKKATIDDVEIITALDVACFQSDFFIMQQRFQETLTHQNREVWLVYFKETCIGKAHVLFENLSLVNEIPSKHEDIRACIHNVCIMPTYQHRGYGTLLLQFLINHLIQNHKCTRMHLTVTAENESAVNLYQKCRFEISDVYEYWNVDI